MSNLPNISHLIWQKGQRFARWLHSRIADSEMKSVLELSDEEFLKKFNFAKIKRHDLQGDSGGKIKILFKHYRQRLKTG